MTISTKQIGDFKTPNKYWVSISNDYYYFNPESEAMDWISDLELFEVKGKTIKVFTTFKGALNYVENELYLGMDFDGIKVNFISIEDRLSGEVYCQVRRLSPENAEFGESFRQDTKFTEEELTKRGIAFK